MSLEQMQLRHYVVHSDSGVEISSPSSAEE